ncbi:MAG: SCP2 sterol-binding domain-containing protein [Caulobacteraceae bacterium]
MATLEEMTQGLQKAVAGGGLDRTLTIDLKGEGFIHLNGDKVTNENLPADCTIIVTKDDLDSMVAGQLDPTMAFMTGKLKINGDMSVAMKLQPLLAAAKA